MPDDIAVSILDLSHSFAGIPALRSLSTTLARGKITGLVGPDGAGKTTLIRLMAGLLKASSGQLCVDNLDPVLQRDELHLRLGYMPQKFGLYEDLTVLENLDLYADLRGVTGATRQSRFNELLAFTDLARFTSRPAGQLSGGMKQKLGLACSLLGEPRVLLLDEPSVGVDPISRRELWKMVGSLADRGMAIVWSTSYLDEAERCDEVRLMNAGVLEYAGTPAALIARMDGRTVQLRHPGAARRQILQRALQSPAVIDGVIQGQALRLVLKTAGVLPDIALLGAGIEAQFVPVQSSLEDAFMDILGGGPGGGSVLAANLQRKVFPPGTDESAVIQASDLTRCFGDFTATDHVSFKVRRGEIFGLLGPNGAGKSTTFKMMCGLLSPSSGQAQVMGIDLKTSASQARQQLGYMAQKFALYGHLSVQQNLNFFAGIYGLSGKQQKAQTERMIQVFALTPYLNTDAGQLPAGFKQRLSLACAMMHEPPLLFLDEPTSGVDPVTRREFWSHINGLADKGVTVMVTTHFMDEAEYCDRIALVYRGKIIATGTPDALKTLAGKGEDINMEEAFIRLIESDDQTRETP